MTKFSQAANQDGIIDVNDVTYLQMHIAGNKNTGGSALIDETNKQLFDCVDMNKDGKLSVSDVTALQIYISNNNQKIKWYKKGYRKVKMR